MIETILAESKPRDTSTVACTRRQASSRRRPRRIRQSAMQHSAAARPFARAVCITHSGLQKATLHAVWLAVLGL